MKALRIIWFIAILLNSHLLYGQDAHFSNIEHNPIYYNPAYTGMDFGLRINTAYRRQWPAIPSKFESYYISFDQSIRIVTGIGGIGFFASSNTEGEGFLQKNTIGVTVSARILFNKNTLVQVGVMPAYTFSNINWDQFVFSGQLNPYYGNIYPSGFTPPDASTSTHNYADIGNVGAIFRYEKTSPQANSIKYYKRFEFGIGGYHLFKPNQSFTGEAAPLPPKITFYTNYMTSISLSSNEYLLIKPSCFMEWQSKMFSYMLGVDADFDAHNFQIGVWWRGRNFERYNTDAIVFMLGYMFSIDQSRKISLYTSISYDFTVSRLKDVTAGSPEITLNLLFGNSTLFDEKPDYCDEKSYQPEKRPKKHIHRIR